MIAVPACYLGCQDCRCCGHGCGLHSGCRGMRTSSEPLSPAHITEELRQAWLPTALICFRKPRASSGALLATLRIIKRTCRKFGGRLQTPGGGCEMRPAAVRVIAQACRGTREEETRNVGGPRPPGGNPASPRWDGSVCGLPPSREVLESPGCFWTSQGKSVPY